MAVRGLLLLKACNTVDVTGVDGCVVRCCRVVRLG